MMKPWQTPLNKASRKRGKKEEGEGDREDPPKSESEEQIPKWVTLGAQNQTCLHKLRVWLLPILLSLVAASPYWSHQQP
jgi:hypothetical protein